LNGMSRKGLPQKDSTTSTEANDDVRPRPDHHGLRDTYPETLEILSDSR